MEETVHDTAYEIKLESFQGPLDLLLFLIKRDEIDIYDIPIAKITEQYLEYLNLMEELNLEMAAEFLLMAASLIQIKLRMLLPADREGEEEAGDDDPRAGLVQQLLEYQKYKKASIYLRQREEEGSAIYFRRPGASEAFQVDGDILVEATVWNLINAYQKIMDQLTKRVPIEIEGEQYTVEEKMQGIRALLHHQEVLRLAALFETVRSKMEAVTLFLAVLELMKGGEIRVFQNANFGEIIIYRKKLSERTIHGA
jgi:segregation and condensation protein A